MTSSRSLGFEFYGARALGGRLRVWVDDPEHSKYVREEIRDCLRRLPADERGPALAALWAAITFQPKSTP